MLHILRIILYLVFFPPWVALNIPYPDISALYSPIAKDTVFSSPVSVGPLENKKLDEASGIAFSQKHEGMLYGHNDSGGRSRIYMFDTLGNDYGTIRLTGVYNRDWEDIAVGPGPDPGQSYLYVGEIGDNLGKYDSIYILRVPEPDTLRDGLELKPEILRLAYPDGARDAETLMVDPLSRDLFVLTKRDSLNVLYRVGIDAFEKKVATLEKVMELPFTMSTGGDISIDGREILIRNYFSIYYWQRSEGESVPEALARKPLLLPYKPEPQGEAIAFHPNGNSYFTLSEERFNIEPILYRYDRK